MNFTTIYEIVYLINSKAVDLDICEKSKEIKEYLLKYLKDRLNNDRDIQLILLK